MATEFSYVLDSRQCDSLITEQVIWIIANLLGENNHEMADYVVKKTSILDFLCHITSV